MAGEFFIAEDNETYWKKLKAYYEARSPEFYEIEKNEYEALEKSEREDSDNHINIQRLGPESKVVDITFYKYLPYNKTAYRCHILDINGNKTDKYFIIKTSDDSMIA